MRRIYLFTLLVWLSLGAMAQQKSASAIRTTVDVLYGYLAVFPNEIGEFQEEPKNIIASINKQKMHGYDEWRIPTPEDLSLLRANGYLTSATYMSTQEKSGVVLLVTTAQSVVEKEKEIQALLQKGMIVDLGLPSGTMWYAEDAGRYGVKEAQKQFGSQLPTDSQFYELINKCTWVWDSALKGYKVTGPNGKSIFFKAAGWRNCDGSVVGVDSYGHYCSSTPKSSNVFYTLYFSSTKVSFDWWSCADVSVRLVHN